MPKTPDADVDRLFQLPLAEFTSARNALAAQLAKDGRKEESASVRAIPKPPVSAWAVNQLHARHRKDLDTLLDVGDRFRKAQAAQLAGKDADLRPLLDARRDATTRLARHAATILREGGQQPTPETLRRVTTTLEALAAYGTSGDAPDAGHLTADVELPGFDALAGLAPGAGARPPARDAARVLPLRRDSAAVTRAGRKSGADSAHESSRLEKRRARQAEAREAVRAAEVTLREARRAESQAKSSLESAATRARAAARDKEAAQKEYELLREAADEAAREAHHLAREAERLGKAVAAAERDLERAEAEAARTRSE